MTLIKGFWVYQSKSQYAPWTFIYYVPEWSVILATLEEIGPNILFLLIFALIILGVANSLIAREFIQPTHKLIYFITHQKTELKEDDTFAHINQPWRAWFEEINNVFKQNYKLVERLECHIQTLDDQVFQRTKELKKMLS